MTSKVFWMALVGIIMGTMIGLYLINAQKYVDFHVESQVASKKVTIKNPIKLQIYLEKLKLYKGVEMPIIGELLDKPASIVRVDKVNVIYTDKVQDYMKTKSNGFVMKSLLAKNMRKMGK